MEEQTFINEGGVIVTKSRFLAPSQTCAMSGITLQIACVILLSTTILVGVASAGNEKPTLNYFRMSKDQFAEYSKLYAPGNAKSKECHLEYLDCWKECIPGCGVGPYGQLVNCSNCYTTEQRCGKPTSVCSGESGNQSSHPTPSGEYWTGEMESRKK